MPGREFPSAFVEPTEEWREFLKKYDLFEDRFAITERPIEDENRGTRWNRYSRMREKEEFLLHG